MGAGGIVVQCVPVQIAPFVLLDVAVVNDPALLPMDRVGPVPKLGDADPDIRAEAALAEVLAEDVLGDRAADALALVQVMGPR